MTKSQNVKARKYSVKRMPNGDIEIIYNGSMVGVIHDNKYNRSIQLFKKTNQYFSGYELNTHNYDSSQSRCFALIEGELE